jgi:hypothetical protein
MMQHLRALSLAACIAAAFGLRAEGPEQAPVKEKKVKPTPAEMFAKFDTDGNGALSGEEFIAPELAAYTAKMGEAEGAAEKVAAKKEQMLKKFAAKDKDGDGSLSLEEFSFKEPKPEKKPKEPMPEPPAAPEAPM